MRVIKTAAVVALMSGCAIATMDVRPASAFTFGDFIRAGRKKTEAQQVQPNQPLPGMGTMVDPQQAAKPLPKVTGPKYYTYKAEPLRRISTDKLLDPVVTGSVRNDALPPMLRTPLADARQFLPDINVRASGDVAKAVEAHYGARMDYIWIGAEGVNAKAKAAVAVLADAAKVGLDPQDYAVNVPADTFDRGDMIAREKELLQFEIALSAATLTYAQDTVRGRIDPNKISGYHDFKRKTVELAPLLDKLSASNDVATLLNDQNPKSAQFAALSVELEKLRAETGAEQRVEIAPGTLLKPGESNPELANIIAGIRLKG
jgi:murein L,D-transpeptidase YcbB/YkuD